MKKRNFLIPLASLVTSLGAADVNATQTASNLNLCDKTAISVANNNQSSAFAFVLQRPEQKLMTAGHYSHSSHRSHSSHYSSRY
jgi:hypothetical protein